MIGRSRSLAGAHFLLGAALLGVNCPGHAEWVLDTIWGGMRYSYSIDERVGQFGEQARARLAPNFAAVTQ